ncbi:unnamed protein product [Acanthoscelides obtectus]|uniref:Peptidase S1 domain-containing protein n=1 Tax=Acanthoscelides obtectus TaxID=200917 RepID=A0A9P0QAZ0_ACAOB|nr:unnamed protein product [Acanthoscelides obtectus]CAK1649538.1 Chymotrypsin-like elastase family member 1 [Acanthoscelides obtectus]
MFCALYFLRWSIKSKHMMYATVGTININGKGGQRIKVETFIMNRKYLESDSGYDIGVVKLSANAKLDRYQEPVRLRKAVLHIDYPSKCFVNTPADYPEICCTSTLSEGKACKGDSGGPLFIMRNGRHIQVGITSHLAILPVCIVNFNNSVYTRVSAYIGWLLRATGIDFTKYNQN